MSFVTKEVKTQTLSEYLAGARKRANLSFEEVSRFTKVQSKYLKALEEARFHDLPANVYVKGFLRSLSPLYRVDQKRLLDQFEAEANLHKNIEEEVFENNGQSKFALPRLVLSPKVLTLLGVGILSLLSFGYIYFQVRSLSRAPSLEIFSPEKDGVVSSGLLTVRGSTEGGSQVFLNGQAIVVDAHGNFQENISLAPGSNKLEIKAINKFGKETIQTRQMVLAEKSIAGSHFSAAESLDELTLELVIEGASSWINLEADGEVRLSGTLMPGFTEKFAAKEKISLSVGNAGSVRVIFNGKDLGILGKEGETLRNIEFTK